MQAQLSSLKLDSAFINIDIKTKKERCGKARHLNSKCYHDTNPFQYLKVQRIEQAHSNNLENIEDVL